MTRPVGGSGRDGTSGGLFRERVPREARPHPQMEMGL